MNIDSIVIDTDFVHCIMGGNYHIGGTFENG